MSDRLNESKLSQSIRPQLRVNKVADYIRANPDKTYCMVRFDEDYDPNSENVAVYEDKGWSVCMDTGGLKDDRTNTPGAEESRIAHPITKNGRGKAQFVLMEIDKEQLLQNEKEKVKKNMDRFIASASGRKAVQKGGELKLTDTEVNETNMNNSREE